MKKLVNGIIVDMTEEEIKEMKSQQQEIEREYWKNISYDEAVNFEIRKKYNESQEFSVLRQKEEKPEEYQEYYNYCESCKAYVKSKKEKFNGLIIGKAEN